MTLEELWKSTKSRLKRAEPLVVAAFFFASFSAFMFLKLAGEMLEGETIAFDETILRELRSSQDLATPIGPAWLTKAMIDITSLGGVTVLALLTAVSVIYLLVIRKRITGLFLLSSVLGGWMISNATKLGVARPRPDLVPHLVEVHDLSFPSGHAMVSAVTYLTLGLMLARTQSGRVARFYFVFVAVLLTLTVGVSRVYLGVHYPTDVIGGWAAGSAWACLCWLVSRRVIPQRERNGMNNA